MNTLSFESYFKWPIQYKKLVASYRLWLPNIVWTFKITYVAGFTVPSIFTSFKIQEEVCCVYNMPLKFLYKSYYIELFWSISEVLAALDSILCVSFYL